MCVLQAQQGQVVPDGSQVSVPLRPLAGTASPLMGWVSGSRLRYTQRGARATATGSREEPIAQPVRAARWRVSLAVGIGVSLGACECVGAVPGSGESPSSLESAGARAGHRGTCSPCPGLGVPGCARNAAIG
ncbi:hypothetical protein KIL84_000007 [Mauremys mutica]|uniref:Uncharacterized protein n=1 Tax=Mauremys mutica TaxID=74926 RepID=A0A9D3XFF5_9SAUR|nr:hypothetical protein KIL84_000007 [Mauremys mutica]